MNPEVPSAPTHILPADISSAQPYKEYLELSKPKGVIEQPERPFDAFIRNAKPEQVLGFLEGCEELAELITREEPDVVFVPLRGAVPMTLTASLIMQSAGAGEEGGSKMPLFVELPVGDRQTIVERPTSHNGERYQIVGKGVGGSLVKGKVIESVVDGLRDSGAYIPGETELMLVDEVQTGSTFTTATTALLESMAKNGDTKKLNVVAMQDNRPVDVNKNGTQQPKALTNGYKNIVASGSALEKEQDVDQREGFKAKVDSTVIELPLFTVDFHALLDTVFLFGDSAESHESYEKIQNEGAARIFKVLVDIYKNPEKAVQELEELRRGELASDLGRTVVQQEILESMTDPVPVKGVAPYNTESATGWWLGFARKALANKAQKSELVAA